MSATVLVVGGAGYIGSHMVKLLGAAGYDVVTFDNLGSGHRDAVLHGDFVKGDLLNPADLRDVFGSWRFGAVMNYAAHCYVGESVSEPAKYYRNNFVGMLNLVDAMREAKVSRLVFSSTCATYGLPQADLIDESHPQSPVNPYGASKLMVERMLADSAAAYGIRSIALRYFNAAGCDPGGLLGERHDPETHLIPLVLAEAQRVRQGGNAAATTLQVNGEDFDTPDRTCVRDYIHVDDLATAHLAALQRLLKDQVASAESYNLGIGRGYSVREVIQACSSVTGVDIGYRVGPRRPGDPPSLVGDAAKARSVLGWSPRYTELRPIVETAWRYLNAPHSKEQLKGG
jgi:UDP-glucose-4-epimerase GalE